MILKPGWKTKALIQGMLSQLPKGKMWNQAIQRHITKSLVLGRDRFQAKVGFGRGHLDNLGRFGADVEGFSVLELGTGRFPIVPLYMFLRGAMHVFSLDIVRLLRDDTVRDTLLMYKAHLEEGCLAEVSRERADYFLEVVLAGRDRLGIGTLQQFNIETRLGDARDTNLPSDSFDLLVSNTTLEHVPGQTLAGIFEHFRSLARPAAVMSHFIDMRDHYAEWDQSITVYNFMRYSEQDWRWFNNSLLYQNRLRISDYRRIHSQTGWEVAFEEADPGSLRDLGSVPLAAEFQIYPQRDLQAPTCWMVSQARRAS